MKPRMKYCEDRGVWCCYGSGLSVVCEDFKTAYVTWCDEVHAENPYTEIYVSAYEPTHSQTTTHSRMTSVLWVVGVIIAGIVILGQFIK